MPHINNKGLVTNDRRKKDVYHYYRAAWHSPDSVPVCHIAVRDWSDRADILDYNGIVVHPVKVYTNFPEVELWINGISLGVRKSENFNAVYQVPLHDGENIIEVRKSGNAGVPADAAIVNLRGFRAPEGKLNLDCHDFAVNVGSNCFFRSDDSGMIWLPDREYARGSLYGHVGGSNRVSYSDIGCTRDVPLLQRCVENLSEYRIDLPEGHYEVELQFAELTDPGLVSAYLLGNDVASKNKKLVGMDVIINDRQVETGFMPGAESGSRTTVKRRYFVDVTDDDGLHVRFRSLDNCITSLNAIKIRKL